MVSNDRIQEASEFVEWLRLSIHEQELPSSNRVRAAGPCFAIAQDHHHAIVFLIKERLYSSCFALVRLEFEAFIRGLWLALCADELQIENFLSLGNWKPPKIDSLICAIEKTPDFSEKTLSQIKTYYWDILCAYTHTGGLHVQRWNTHDGIEPNYSPDEVGAILYFSELIGALSVAELAELGNHDEITQRVLVKIDERITTSP